MDNASITLMDIVHKINAAHNSGKATFGRIEAPLAIGMALRQQKVPWGLPELLAATYGQPKNGEWAGHHYGACLVDGVAAGNCSAIGIVRALFRTVFTEFCVELDLTVDIGPFPE